MTTMLQLLHTHRDSILRSLSDDKDTATAAAVGDGAPWSNDGVGEWGAVEAAGTESTKEGTKEGPKEGAKEGPKDFKELLGGDSDNDEDDLKIDQAIKSTATSLWNFVLGD